MLHMTTALSLSASSMDDAEVDLSTHYLLPNPEMNQSFDELLKGATATCTHTHACNPPGPAAATHTHTCFHTHTQVFATGEEERIDEEESKKFRKPLGNREAVRKYREKKKAHAAFLEEEVKKLRLMNQQLVRRLQGQAALEAEVIRLRSLLVDIRGKIDAELGGLPFQKQCNPSGLQCDSKGQCLGGNPEVVNWEVHCVPAIIDCEINPLGGATRQNFGIVEAANSMDEVGSLVSSAS